MPVSFQGQIKSWTNERKNHLIELLTSWPQLGNPAHPFLHEIDENNTKKVIKKQNKTKPQPSTNLTSLTSLS
jgi:hypothetical protein